MKFTLPFLLWLVETCIFVSWNYGARSLSAEDLLVMGNNALAANDTDQSIEHYQRAASALAVDESILITLSIHTNLATALSSQGRDSEAAESYRRALRYYIDNIEEIVDDDVKRDANDIAAQASFFLGQVYQELGQAPSAADAYAFANTLDPYHWASLANLGSVLQDNLRQYREALASYNKAYNILTETPDKATDAPPDARFILSQLQYRIGLCITYDMNQKCVLEDEPDKPISCQELATHAFSLAIQYDPDNESAKHWLATVTADATMTRASNTYVQSLFDEYAKNFEHSLVVELGYNGYERLRQGVDRAFGGREHVPTFSLVVDAGCGTGLVGEQFRNISLYLVGVDLSAVILEEAQKTRPDLYNETRAGDMTQIFRDLQPISLIIAADSYIYFGDLQPLFESMEDGLADGGYAAFTLENVDLESELMLSASKPDWRWQLTASGRFAHRKDYVVEVGTSHQLELVYFEPLDNFRQEKGAGVRGHLFVMQKVKKQQQSSSSSSSQSAVDGEICMVK